MAFVRFTPAIEKLFEAKFFLEAMEANVRNYEFKYLMSAFLSAVSSCVEHNKLHWPGDDFAEWYERTKSRLRSNDDWKLLRNLRNTQVHQVCETYQTIGLSFPDGIEMRAGSFIESDFSTGVTRYKVSEDSDVVERPSEMSWVWYRRDTSIEVLPLCRKVYSLVQDIVHAIPQDKGNPGWETMNNIEQNGNK